MPEYANPQDFNRYSYVRSNPLRYVDLGGHQGTDWEEAFETAHGRQPNEQDRWDYQFSQQMSGNFPGWEATYEMRTLLYSANVMLQSDSGLYWTAAEVNELYLGVRDLTGAMGGIQNFVGVFGTMEFVLKKNLRFSGQQRAKHKIWLSAGKFEHWTVVHELGHAWDAISHWSIDMQLQMGARSHWQHILAPGNPRYWYDPGNSPPPKGIDQNTNRREDFAEAIAAYVYPLEAQASVQGGPYDYANWGFADYLSTPRGQYIAALMANPR